MWGCPCRDTIKKKNNIVQKKAKNFLLCARARHKTYTNPDNTHMALNTMIATISGSSATIIDNLKKINVN